jgi:hypothetical protein
MSTLPNNFLVTIEEIQAIEAIIQAGLPLLIDLEKGAESLIDHVFHPTLAANVATLSTNQNQLLQIITKVKSNPVSSGSGTAQ